MALETNETARAIVGWGDVYEPFPTVEKARKYALKMAEKGYSLGVFHLVKLVSPGEPEEKDA